MCGFYIKIVSEDEKDVRGFGCQQFRLARCNDGVFLRFGQAMREREIVSGSTVFIMNSEGKTIDKMDF